MIAEPIITMVDRAIEVARESPCAKSKRGVVIYHPTTLEVFAEDTNSPPNFGKCIANDECRATCAKRCVHAESRAIRTMLINRPIDHRHLHLVHIKLNEQGMGVPGGPPSCWQCSREILDVYIGGVWLWEYDEATPESAAIHGKGVWRFYTAEEFHAATMRNCGIP